MFPKKFSKVGKITFFLPAIRTCNHPLKINIRGLQI